MYPLCLQLFHHVGATPQNYSFANLLQKRCQAQPQVPVPITAHFIMAIRCKPCGVVNGALAILDSGAGIWWSHAINHIPRNQGRTL